MCSPMRRQMTTTGCSLIGQACIKSREVRTKKDCLRGTTGVKSCAYSNFRAGCIVLSELPEGFSGRNVRRLSILAERVVLRGIPHVDILPTNCQCEGSIRQRTHGSRVACWMERAAARFDVLHKHSTDLTVVEGLVENGHPSCPPQKLTRSVSWSPAPWRISDS